MAQQKIGFEGQTSGTTITTANSDDFGDSILASAVASAGATLTYDSAWAAHGTLSAKSGNLIAGSTTILAYTFAATPACAQRLYFRLDALPTTTSCNLLQYRHSPDSSANGVTVTPAGLLSVSSAESSAAKYTSTYALQTNTLYRLEGGQTLAAGTGRVWASLYLGESTTPIVGAGYDSGTTLTNNTVQPNFGAGRAGKLTSTAVMSNLWIDDWVVQDGSDAAIGPVAPPATTIVPDTTYITAHSGLTPAASYSLADHKTAFFAGAGSLADRERAWLAAHSSVTGGSLADMRRGTITA